MQPLGTPVPPTQPPAVPVVAHPAVDRLPPRLPPESPWWDNPWPAIVIGILGLVVGGLLGYALARKGETVTEARGRGPAVTRTVTNTTTVVRPKVVVQTNTVTQTPP